MENFSAVRGFFRHAVCPPRQPGRSSSDFGRAGARSIFWNSRSRRVTYPPPTISGPTFTPRPPTPYRKPYPWPRDMFRGSSSNPRRALIRSSSRASWTGRPITSASRTCRSGPTNPGWVNASLDPACCLADVGDRGHARPVAEGADARRLPPLLSVAREDELHDMVSYKFHDFGRRGGAYATQIATSPT